MLQGGKIIMESHPLKDKKTIRSPKLSKDYQSLSPEETTPRDFIFASAGRQIER
jgi:hypothetical protein